VLGGWLASAGSKLSGIVDKTPATCFTARSLHSSSTLRTSLLCHARAAPLACIFYGRKWL